MKLSSLFNSQHIRISTLGSIAIKFSSALFALFNGILLARMLSVKDFGIYVLVFTTVMILTIPVSLGLPNLITRYVSKYKVEGNLQAIKGLLIRSNQWVLLGLLGVLVLASLTYGVWWHRFEMAQAIWYALLLLPFLALGNIRSAALRGMKWVVLGQIPETFVRNLVFFLGLMAFFFFGKELTLEYAFLTHAGAAMIAFAMGVLFLRVKLFRSLKNIPPVFHNREWRKAALPFLINGGAQTLKSKSIPYILAIFGTMEAVAIFDVAMRGAQLVSFTLGAVNSAIAPYISTAFEKGDMKSLQQIVTKANRLVFAFSVVVVIVFIVGGESLITTLFGSEYAVAYIPLLILCVGQLVHTLTGSVGPVLNMTGHQAYLSKNLLQMLLLGVVLSVVLIIPYNVLGASWAFTSTLVVQNAILVLYIRKKLGVNTTIFS
ncbi:MAG: oligosaccharide flippase family protein [Flavobacteriaceae bacterium]|nr:oligosaccharide flippase family protein [Flavobacteriaceae bacterium]